MLNYQATLQLSFREALYYQEDILSEVEPKHFSHQHLGIALLAALFTHFALLYLWEVDKPIKQVFPILKLKLAPKEEEETPILKKELIQKKPPLLEQNIESPTPAAQTPELVKETTPPTHNLYERAIHTIKNNLLPKTQKFKSFSVSDFPQKEIKGDPYSAPQSIPVLISAARQVNYIDSQGYGMIMKNDGFGNVTCSQQRPGAGTEGPMWYPVPASMCGHLK